MKASEIEAAASVAGVVREGDTLSAEATWFLARALLHLHGILPVPLPDDLATIEGLLAAATVAPWHAGVDADGEFPDSVYATQDPAREALVSCDEEADAVFVAAIRNAAPRLLAGIRAQAATIRERDETIGAQVDEMARLDRLAKAERAMRVAQDRISALGGADRNIDQDESDALYDALEEARADLRSAGGEP